MARLFSSSRSRSAITAAALVAAALAAPLWAATPKPGATGVASQSVAYDLATLLPADMTYRDQSGQSFTAEDLAGRLVLLDVVSTHCPSLCAVRALDMVSIDAAIPADVRSRVRLVSLAVGEGDQPDGLHAFADGLRLSADRWSLVSGGDKGAARFLRALALLPAGAKALKAGEEPPTSLFLFDRQGRLMQRYGGRPVDRKRIAREIADLDAYDTTLSAAASRPATTTTR